MDRIWTEAPEYLQSGRVPAKQVPTPPGQVRQDLGQGCRARAAAGGRYLVGCRQSSNQWLPRKREKARPLGTVHAEGPRHRVEHLRSHGDVTALFQPCVPSYSDRCEIGYLFAPKARRAPGSTYGQPSLVRRHTLPPGAHKITEFSAAFEVVGWVEGRSCEQPIIEEERGEFEATISSHSSLALRLSGTRWADAKLQNYGEFMDGKKVHADMTTFYSVVTFRSL